MASSKSSKSATSQDTAVKSKGLPLFFVKPTALDKTRHAKSGLKTEADFSFARQTNSIALNAIEFIEAAKDFPIVFSAGDEPAALAVVGLEQQNYFVQSDNSWQADSYIPAYVRQYPFIFFENADDQKLFLCVDEKSPHFRVEGDDGANTLFNKDGSPSPMTNQALEFCNSYYRHHRVTRNLVEDLKAHNLLAPYQSQLKLKSGRDITLSGFLMIDEAAFNALDEKTFLEFRKKGWLAFIYLALTSASNWKRLASLAESLEVKAA
jgi:hypothetical protein